MGSGQSQFRCKAFACYNLNEGDVYCKQHKCIDSGCSKKRYNKLTKYCSEHICKRRGCINKGLGYYMTCEKH